MTMTKTAAVILAAGLGTRMKSATPKVLHPLAGQPMILHLLATLKPLNLARQVVVIGADMAAVRDAVNPLPTAVQKPALGTGHAVMAAKKALKGFGGDVLVLFGDNPLIRAATIERMLEARRKKPEPAVVVLGLRLSDPHGYGRLVMGAGGRLEAIVEEKDATAKQKKITLCNAGAMLIAGRQVWRLLARLDAKNAKGEYYLTDVVTLARREKLRVAVVEGDETAPLGVNSRAELAQAEAVLQDRLRRAAMEGGATLLDPATVYLSFDTRLGRDVTIGPYVQFGPGVSVGDGAEIRAFSHIEGAAIAAGARIGPFSRLRPGAAIGKDAHIGNFVEIKNAVIETGAKVNHLTYVGDARVGAKANVGAGTITCNYDGFGKYHTDIGAGAFIGSNVALVAPVKVGNRAIVGAGSVITKDVAADSLAITRAPQQEAKGAAKRLAKQGAARAKASKEKN
ncbi:MAG TPA: bifunctional UDP-N-acetylglucosamine diphosphorylase/glucosamine-1-phosphate N-acetyltransferase GlmU [Rhodospirillales bacterium]